MPWSCVTSSAGTRIGSFAAQVDLVTLGVEVGASRLLQDKVARQPNMTVTTNHAVKAFRGKERLEEVVVEDQATGEEKTWDYDGVFVFIGLSPNTALLQGKADLDDREFAVTDDRLRTTPGVFAAGDVRAGPTKQAASAVGEGATAALMMREHLRRIG